MWHVTHDMWHVTHDMWHVTHDMLGGMNILSKLQLPSSYCLWSMILWYYEDMEEKAHSLSDEAVYRTALVHRLC